MQVEQRRQPRHFREPVYRAALVTLTLACGSLAPATAAAQVNGRAQGIEVNIHLVPLLGSPFTTTVGPTPVAQLPVGGGQDASDLLAAQIAALNLGTLVGADAFHVETSSLPGNTTIASMARVNNLSIAAGLVHGDQLVARCQQTASGLTGEVEATNLSLLGAGVQLPSPNLTVSVAGLANVILNKQTVTTVGGVNTLTVKALELEVLPSAGLGPGFGLVGSLLNLVIVLLNSITSADVSVLEVTCSMPATPTITGVAVGGVTPAVGPDTGGTIVTITGTNFAQGTTITFDGLAPVTSTIVSTTQLTAVTPPHAAGAVSVTLTTPVGATDGTTTLPNGSAVSPGGFTYLASATLTGVAPPSGLTTGGYPVTLTGTFDTVQSVTIGGIAAAVVSTTPTQVVVTAPPHPAGSAQILVQTTTGSATGLFTYISTPVIMQLTPTQGGGGQVVTIVGTDFYPGLTVTICGQALTPTTPATGPFTQVVFTAPVCGGGGTQIVTLTNPDGGTDDAPLSFTYQSAPALASITPAVGPVEGGTAVTIAGSNFDGSSTVSMGGSAATSVVLVDANTLTALSPAHAAGSVDVVVTTGAGSATLSQAFLYKAFLPTACAEQFGLDASDTDGDPDNDGLTNLEECTASPVSHPRGLYTRYFGEGAQSPDFFETRFAILNPGVTQSARVLATFLTSTGAEFTSLTEVPVNARRTIDVGSVAGMATSEFATTIESDVPVVANRLMQWSKGDRYGSHAEASIAQPGLEWYLAEGATHSGFNLFYLIQNSHTSPATIDVEYLLATGSSFTRTYTVAARSRFNIWVNHELGLEEAEVSAVFRSTNSVPVIVERAMYRDSPTAYFNAGHNAAAVAAPQTTWYFAEGLTGDLFDTFLLVANPNDSAVSVEASYFLPGGQAVVRNHVVGPRSRYNIWVDATEGTEMASTAFSVRLVASSPIIAERAMWWPGSADTWHEAHASFGQPSSHLRWAVAEGEAGGATGMASYLLVANPEATTAELTVSLHFEDGTRTSFQMSVAAASRDTVDLSSLPQASGRRFSAIVESTNGVPVVVESAWYSNSMGGVTWAAGASAPATPLP